MNKPELKKAIKIIFYGLLVFVASVMLARAMPYRLIKEWRFPFTHLEISMYTAIVLFMIIKLMEPGEETTKLFTFPIADFRNSKSSYQRRDLLVSLIIVLTCFAYLLSIYDKGIPNLDEGWILAMSNRVLQGDLPYRDFFLLPSPGSVYLNTWMFRFFGTSIIAERLATLLLASLGTLATYLLARLGMGTFFSVGASLLFLVWQIPIYFQANYSWYAVVFSICSFFMMGLFIKDSGRSRWKLLLAGSLCAMSFMFKQNVGALTLIAVVLYLPAERIFFDRETNRSLLFPLFPSCFRTADLRAFIKQHTIILSGFAIPLGVWAFVFLHAGSLRESVQGVFLTPLLRANEFYAQYGALTRLTDTRLMIYMPHFMSVLTFVVLLKKFRRGTQQDGDRFPLLMLLAVLFTHFSAYPRADFIHVIYSVWPGFILFAYWLQQAVLALSYSGPLRLRIFGFSFCPSLRQKSIAMLLVACIPLTVFLVRRTEKNIVLEKDLVEIAPSRGKGIYGKRLHASELNELLAFIDSHIDFTNSETIFSTNPLVYFLGDRKNPTPYDYILAGNGPDGYEEEIIEVLETRRPGMAVIDRSFTGSYTVPRGWNRIEDYIYSTYETAYDSRRYEVLLLKDDPEETVQKRPPEKNRHSP